MAKRHSAFTLIEILIVVIILGILAAIVIPQFSNAAKDAKVSAAQSSEQSIRSQISLYKLQHNDTLPDLVTSPWTALTQKTDISGTLNVAGLYGPYLPIAPSNPYNGLTTVANVTIAAGTEPTSNALLTATTGWLYDNVNTGRIWATTALK